MFTGCLLELQLEKCCTAETKQAQKGLLNQALQQGKSSCKGT